MDLKLNIVQRENVGKVRSAQEDSHETAIFTRNGNIFVLCDGMGGHVGGRQASSIAVNRILEYLQKQAYDDIGQALEGALQFANMQILGYANEHPELKGMGTTACILLVKDDMAYIAHVGDSRIYLFLGKENELHRITKDHSYVQAMVDAGKITDREAENHPNKNRILKALGVEPGLRPTIVKKPILPKKGDVFLLCSDGLTDMVNDRVIEKILSDNTPLAAKGDRLIECALANGGFDNVTVQLIEITESRHKKSVFRSYNPTGRPQHSGIARKQPGKRKKILAAVLVPLLVLALLAGGAIWGLNKTVEKAYNKIEYSWNQCFPDNVDTNNVSKNLIYQKIQVILDSNYSDETNGNEVIKTANDAIQSQQNSIKAEIGKIISIYKMLHLDTARLDSLRTFADTTLNSVLKWDTDTTQKIYSRLQLIDNGGHLHYDTIYQKVSEYIKKEAGVFKNYFDNSKAKKTEYFHQEKQTKTTRKTQKIT